MKISVLILFGILTVCKGQFISGGSAASINEYPFAASLLTSAGGSTFSYGCGGSVLTATAILSAASCFYTNGTAHQPGWWQVRVGSSNAVSGGAVHQISVITTHPDFDSLTLVNDIAVLRTASAIALQPGVVEAARIAGGAFQFERNQRVVAIGWGSARDSVAGDLHRVQTFAIDQDVCAVRYSDFGFAIDSNMVCVGWLDVGVHGQCPEGGAGSALLVDEVVVGVYSWTQGCAPLRHPNLNTRAAPYWRWILTTATAALP